MDTQEYNMKVTNGNYSPSNLYRGIKDEQVASELLEILLGYKED